MVHHIDDVEIPLRIKAQFMRQIESSLEGGTAIALVASLSCASNGADSAIRCYAANALTGVFAEPDRAIRAAHDAEGIVDLRCGGGTAITAAAFDAVPGKGGDGPLGNSGRLNKQSKGED